jgi:hypothetical protein
MRLDVLLELFHQKGNALRAAALVSNRIFDDNLVENRAVVQLDKESVSDGARRRLMVGDREVRVLHAVNLGAQRVDTGVRGGGVGVGVRGEFAEDEGVCNHVADRVAFGETCVSDFVVNRGVWRDLLSVCKVVQGALFVYDADGSLLGADAHALDVI